MLCNLDLRPDVGLQRLGWWTAGQAWNAFVEDKHPVVKTGRRLFSLVALPIGILSFGSGLGLHHLGRLVRPHRPFKFTVVPTTAFPSKEIVLYQNNVAMMPGPLTKTNGGTAFAPERVDELGRRILHSGANVVMLQELFDKGASRRLIQILQQQGFTHFFHHVGCDDDPLAIGSGLFLAAKFTLRSPEYIPFDLSLSTKFAEIFRKGAIVADMTLSGRNVRLICTHLVDGDSSQSTTMRLAQIELLKMRCHHTGTTLVAGDVNFNQHKDSPEKTAALATFTDVLATHIPRTTTSWTDALTHHATRGKKGSRTAPDEALDAVYTCGADGWTVKNVARIDAWDRAHPARAFSDHHAFKATFVPPR